MKEEFAALRGEMREGFEKMEERFDKVDRRFEKADERFERSEIRSDERFEKAEIRGDERFEAMMDRLYSMQRMMFQFCGLMFTALIGLIATQI
jgi:hypothetical protein